MNLLDQQIEKTVRTTEAAREQIRLLHADWTLLNQPDRLQKLADQFLTLKPANPAQFTSLAELDSRLPAVPPPPAAPLPDQQPPAGPMIAVAEPPPVVTPAANQTVAPPHPKLAETQPPAAHRDLLDRAKPDATKPSTRSPDAALAAAVPRPLPRAARTRPPVIEAAAHTGWPPRPLTPVGTAQPMMMSGSLLGMAHAAGALPPPMPAPLSGWANGN